MLIVMAGLPGSGKSTLARELARSLPCALLSVDPIEAALWRAGIDRAQPTGLAAYVVAEDLAREQLRAGGEVLVDAVNDADAARDQWRSLAAEMGSELVFIEVFCSDTAIHEHRLAQRRRDIPGFPEPTWESVLARRANFESWDEPRLRLDSVRPLADNVAEALDRLKSVRTTP
jgi:predicted kinase